MSTCSHTSLHFILFFWKTSSSTFCVLRVCSALVFEFATIFIDLVRCSYHDCLYVFFSIRDFFHGHCRLTGEQEKGEDHLLFHSTTSTRSRTFRHLFSFLHVRSLSHIFDRTACIYQTATRWGLLPYGITIRLIDYVMLIFVW